MKLRITLSLLALCIPLQIHATERWYSESQATAGKAVFDTHCAICHGAEAAGTGDWRKPLADGRYPPPPLNGTAHAWHHPLGSLRRQIKQGGAQYGGWMPALGSMLSNEQVDQVIAYFQSLWRDEIYTAWLKNDASNRQTDASTENEATIETESRRDAMLRHLTARLPRANLGEPEETPLKGIYRLSLDDKIIYISSDGRYVFLGDMVDLVSGRNISKMGVP